jgi:hypothetical protein
VGIEASGLEPELVISALRDAESRVRKNALRLASSCQEKRVVDSVLAIERDPSARALSTR